MKSYKAVGLITIAIIISIIIMMPPAFSGEDKIPTPKSPVLRLRTLVKGTHISNAASIRTASSVISSSDPCNICSGADCSQKQNAMGAMISMGTEGEEPVPEANFGFGSYTLIYGNIFGFHGGAAVADWGGPVQTQMTAGSYICMPAVGAFEKSAGFSEPICPGPAGSSCPAWAPVYMEYIASPP